jgi:hypothetical protein
VAVSVMMHAGTVKKRKLQLYVTEHQYWLLRQRARKQGSIAAVVRGLIDRSLAPSDAEADLFFRHVAAAKEGSGDAYDAVEAKRDLYRRPM